MLYGMMSYFAKLTGEDLLRYLNKIKSVGVKKSKVLALDRRCKKVYIFMAFTSRRPYILVDRNENR